MLLCLVPNIDEDQSTLFLDPNVDVNMNMDIDLNQRFSVWGSRRFLSPGDIWQFLEMFLIVTMGVCYWHLVNRSQGYCSAEQCTEELVPHNRELKNYLAPMSWDISVDTDADIKGTKCHKYQVYFGESIEVAEGWLLSQILRRIYEEVRICLGFGI